ncbi:hypothetical protein BCV72DRAFT_231102 [Rhizopus microsporus var. microsporus]|uniref:Uncharacterized protein n=2 Tax=Rhizopus microsporus TaxID=58291 RepID=A0A2G4T0Q4_RHIZD|nr:uncharacterized protein RHIMIDRAFT_275602 [Rhizopus microsporus ATCC 52813]ORE04738.1 hypothetical protein BCV72DRAFT_231102 [Rhizopus microsporus var. microsporus]PHZ14581.1 hypothetical protein RHIMIDRAFT_275602 [Rhizopus microsporus ATCC 52813]
MRTYEDAILNEAEHLVENINKLKACASQMNDEELINIIEKLRRIEKKTSLVCTFFRASAFNHLKQTQNTNRPPFYQ